MSLYLGDFAEDATVYIPFNTFDSNDPAASVTVTSLTDAMVHVHKDGSATQIIDANDGVTVSKDFDTVTGNHLITIDTSAHADYAVGSDYQVRIEGLTVDAGTLNVWVGSFSIENRYKHGVAQTADNDTKLTTITGSDGATLATAQALYAPAKVADLGTVQTADHTAAIALIPQSGGTTSWNATALAAINAEADTALTDYDPPTRTEATADKDAIIAQGDAAWTTGAGGSPPDLLQTTTIATLATQISFTLTAGSTDDDAYNGATVIVTDQATATQKAIATIGDYTGATKTVTLLADPAIFTMATGDTIDVLAGKLDEAQLQGASLAAINAYAPATEAKQDTMQTAVDAVKVFSDASTAQTADHTAGIAAIPTTMVGTDNAATAAELAKVPKSDSTVSWNATALAAINAEADTALTDYDPPTRTEATADKDAIITQGDAAWTTGAGGSPPTVLQTTTIATLASQTSFTLTAGSADDDAYNGQKAIVTDQSTGTQKAVGSVSDYTGSTKTVTLTADPGIFTMATGDAISIVVASSGGGDATSANQDSIISTLASVTAITTPATSRAAGSTLNAYIGETVPFPPITPRDVDGTVLDTTAITLQVIIEGRTTTDVATIADGSITKTSTTIQFSGPAAANTTLGQKQWAARRTDNNVVVAQGPYVVDYAPQADA